MVFQAGNIPWNKGKVGVQEAWNKGMSGQIPWNKERTGVYNEKTLQKMRESKIGKSTWKTPYIQKGIPLYNNYAHQIEFCEKVRRNNKDPNILEVTCAYCGKWIIPKVENVRNRIKAVNKGGERRFYCSENCKHECPIYRQQNYYRGQQGRPDTSREVQPELRQMVFERDNWTCQRCESKESLHCHHLTGVELNPIESADIDNCITLCKTCHHWVHSQEGCKYYDFRRKKCEEN